ncbi:MAG: hypothetical protein Q3996_00110 [Candidatus Saccharibacteria bacterium]|nr:hypothetical protein [Candidatus Saccharibacteria bacterium]
MTHSILKANGQTETFSKQKFINSIQTSCIAVGCGTGEAELFAEQVYRQIAKWIENKPEFTSSDLRLQTYQILTVYNPEAAFFYRTYKQII